jgi:transcriptional regulator with XRE-family HTH domain
MNALEQLRLDKGWSRKDLAEESGISDETIRRIEEHGGVPRAGTAAALAGPLGVSASDLVARLRVHSEPEAA